MSIKVLTEANGWSQDHARGYVDGENFRRLGITPPRFAQVGIDEYCLGFRAAYYDRIASSRSLKIRPATGQG
jgi:hypothetical protein